MDLIEDPPMFPHRRPVGLFSQKTSWSFFIEGQLGSFHKRQVGLLSTKTIRYSFIEDQRVFFHGRLKDLLLYYLVFSHRRPLGLLIKEHFFFFFPRMLEYLLSQKTRRSSFLVDKMVFFPRSLEGLLTWNTIWTSLIEETLVFSHRRQFDILSQKTISLTQDHLIFFQRRLEGHFFKRLKEKPLRFLSQKTSWISHKRPIGLLFRKARFLSQKTSWSSFIEDHLVFCHRRTAGHPLLKTS